MGSKIWLLLGLSIASALFISSGVAARNLAEFTSKTADGGSLDSASDYHVGGSCSNSGGGSHHGRGRCCYHYCHGRCCSTAEAQALEAAQVKPQN
ncbi:hypothetical protein AgCh_030116 [Apium graveolens]